MIANIFAELVNELSLKNTCQKLFCLFTLKQLLGFNNRILYLKYKSINQKVSPMFENSVILELLYSLLGSPFDS